MKNLILLFVVFSIPTIFVFWGCKTKKFIETKTGNLYKIETEDNEILLQKRKKAVDTIGQDFENLHIRTKKVIETAEKFDLFNDKNDVTVRHYKDDLVEVLKKTKNTKFKIDSLSEKNRLLIEELKTASIKDSAKIRTKMENIKREKSLLDNDLKKIKLSGDKILSAIEIFIDTVPIRGTINQRIPLSSYFESCEFTLNSDGISLINKFSNQLDSCGDKIHSVFPDRVIEVEIVDSAYSDTEIYNASGTPRQQDCYKKLCRIAVAMGYDTSNNTLNLILSMKRAEAVMNAVWFNKNDSIYRTKRKPYGLGVAIPDSSKIPYYQPNGKPDSLRRTCKLVANIVAKKGKTGKK